jgi:heavy metal sensor kinase
MARGSISLRLTVLFSSAVFAGLVLFGGVMWYHLRDTLTTGRSRTLERRAERLAELLRGVSSEPAALRTRKFLAFASATGAGLIEVFQKDGTRALPSPSAASQSFPWPAVAGANGDRFSEITFQGQPYRVLARAFDYSSERLVLCVAAPLEGNHHLLQTFSEGLFWMIPAMLCISGAGGYLLSRRALKPVDEITAATRSISLSNLSERLPVPATGDELQRLSETCNEMLARLESAVNEIKRFTADASHELRNPISFVRTTAELALREPQITSGSRRAFEQIVSECAKAQSLLKDMLTLARADDGNSRLAFEPVDLAEVLRTVCQKARLLAETRGHQFIVSFAGGNAAAVWGDYAALQRLLWILLDNAVKYTPAPGVIELKLASGIATATVTVEDNGIGIAAADLPHIFDRFYRADPSRSRVEGAGLGLAIARWIAKVHNATLWAESKENAGAVFRIVFPLLAERQTAPPVSATPLIDPEPAAHS